MLEKSKILLTAHITPYEYQSTQRSHSPQSPQEPAFGHQSGVLETNRSLVDGG